MNVENLSLQHVKSHLQKVRLQHQLDNGGGGGGGEAMQHTTPSARRVTAPRSAGHHQHPHHGGGAGRHGHDSPCPEDSPEEEIDPVTGAMAHQLLLQQELYEHLNAQRQLQAALESHAAQLNALVAAQHAMGGGAAVPTQPMPHPANYQLHQPMASRSVMVPRPSGMGMPMSSPGGHFMPGSSPPMGMPMHALGTAVPGPPSAHLSPPVGMSGLSPPMHGAWAWGGFGPGGHP
jgi:hypothetical protein